MVKKEERQNNNLRRLLHKIIIRLPKINIRKPMCFLILYLLYIFIYFYKASFTKLKIQCMHIIYFKIILKGHLLPIPAPLTRDNFDSVCCVCTQHIYGSFSILLTNGSSPHMLLCFLLYLPLTICLRVCQCQCKWFHLILFRNAQHSIRSMYSIMTCSISPTLMGI